MEYILCVAIGLYVGYKAGEAVTMWLTVKALKELNIGPKELEQLLAKLKEQNPTETTAAQEELPNPDAFPKIAIEIEQVGSMLYAYQKENGRFVGQATTPEDLIRCLSEKFTNVKLTVAREDGGELMGGTNWNFDQKTKELTTKTD